MQNLEWFDYLRMITALFAFASLYVSALRALRSWDIYTERLRGLVWLLQGLLFLLGEGSIEQVLINAPWGPRTLISFILAVGGFRIIIKNEGLLKSE